MSKVLGIDTKSTGMHWVSNFGIGMGDTDRGEKYGWISCKDKDVEQRRLRIVNYATMFFTQLNRDHWLDDEEPIKIFCEEPLALQNGKTTRLLGLAAGAIWGAFIVAAPNAEWHWVDQSSWKKSVLGRGIRPKDYIGIGPKAGWEKEWIRETVRELPGFIADWGDHVVLEDFDDQNDLYDAWAIKTYGVRALT